MRLTSNSIDITQSIQLNSLLHILIIFTGFALLKNCWEC